MNNIRHKFTMSDSIASQLIRNDIPGLAAMTARQPFEEAFRSGTVATRLKKNINNVAIPKALATLMGQALLIDCSS